MEMSECLDQVLAASQMPELTGLRAYLWESSRGEWYVAWVAYVFARYLQPVKSFLP